MAKKVDDKTLMGLCLSGKAQVQIAKELGMTKAQICRRINTPEFKELLSEYRNKMLDGILTDLTVHSQKAVKTLVNLLDSDNPFCQLQAACKILTLSQEYGIQHDLLTEIEKLKTYNKL